MLYSPSDLLKNYKELQLQLAILKYIACNGGITGEEGVEGFLEFAKHLDQTIADNSFSNEITETGIYLCRIGLLEVIDHKLYITKAGLECLQKYTLQSATMSMQIGFISHVNWVVCTLISLLALLISLLK